LKVATEPTIANTQPAEAASTDSESADPPPDQPSKAQLALLEKLLPKAPGDAQAGASPDATTVPLQRDSGIRRGHPRR
jgi:hypothetical protein